MFSKSGNKIGTWLVIGMLIAAAGSAGCGGVRNAVQTTEETEGNTEDKAMGRYAETENDVLKDVMTRRAELMKLEDGSLVVFDISNGKYLSKDGGETWEHEELSWYEEFKTDSYIMGVAVSSDGYTAVIYSPIAEGDNKAGQTQKPDAGEAALKEAESGEGKELGTDDYEMHPEYRIIAPDGTYIDFELPYEGADYVNRWIFSEEGRLFGAAYGGRIYEIDKTDGSCQQIAELSANLVFQMSARGHWLVCSNTKGISIIDVDTKEIVEDKALEDFTASQYGSSIEYSTAYSKPLISILAEDELLYLICDKGIYRHVIGGNVMEQIADGALTALNDPSHELAGGLLMEDESFLVLFAGGSLIRYTYDPNMPTVPEIQLKAYSLTENQALKLAITKYQTAHPEVYVKYETGLAADSSMTRDDALKKLNTEIVAGTGPDLLLLDDMPVDSYRSKGILLDISPYLKKLPKEEYFFNILNSFASEEGIYAVPAQFVLPLCVGRETELKGLTDLKALADETEKIRSTMPEGNILGAITEEELLTLLLPASAPAWVTDNKELDTEALSEFFIQAERIWAAEKKGITEERIGEYEKQLNEWRSYGMTAAEINEYKYSLSTRILDYLVDKQQLVLGTLDGNFDFSTIVSSFEIKGKTDSYFAADNGQAGGVYIPRTLAGISSKSYDADKAGELLVMLLQSEGSTWGGFPVNKTLWDRMFENPYSENESFGSMAVETVKEEGGASLSLDVYWPTEEQTGRLLQIAEQAGTPYLKDLILEEAVCETGVDILDGSISIEDGVKEIERRLAIYLAE